MIAATKSYQLRPARPGDIPQVLGLMREMADFEQLGHLLQATSASLENSLFGPQPAVNCLVGCPDEAPDTLVAYIMWFHNYSSFLDKRGLYLEDIYVQPAHRGKGLGSLALRHLAKTAVDLDCGRFEWTVLDWNRHAIDFYERHGAQLLPEWRIVRVSGEALLRMAGSA